MRKFIAPSILGLSLSLVGTLAPAPARAHFQLKGIDDKTDVSWMSQDAQGAPQKTGPCAAVGMGAGDPAGTPTGKVTDVKAGQMVSIAVNGTVGHPGWYRVSLIEGSSSSQTLTTLPDPALQTGCTATMIKNPVWSTTQPVIGDALPAGSTATSMQSGTAMLKVMIPQNANCTTAKPCTLQVVMIMTDHSPPSCFYHHCADITLSGGTGAGGASGGGAGGRSSSSGGAGGHVGVGGLSGSGAGGDTTTASGGTSGSGGASATGGASASGGSSASGGMTSSGGSSASGGSTSSGGTLASGGTTGSGGKGTSSGGTPGSGGSPSTSGSGGASPGADNSSGGCAVAAHRSGAGLIPLLVGLVLVAGARRRRARR